MSEFTPDHALPGDRVVVLHVERDPADGHMLASVLRDVWPGAFEVARVAALQPALERLARGDVDCILLGLRLPDAKALEVLGRLARAAPHVPVVVLTDSDDEELGVSAVRAGAQDFLAKGTDGYALGRALRYAVERKRRELELTRRAS